MKLFLHWCDVCDAQHLDSKAFVLPDSLQSSEKMFRCWTWTLGGNCSQKSKSSVEVQVWVLCRSAKFFLTDDMDVSVCHAGREKDPPWTLATKLEAHSVSKMTFNRLALRFIHTGSVDLICKIFYLSKLGIFFCSIGYFIRI